MRSPLFVIAFAALLLAACNSGERQRLQLEELERQNRADSLMLNDSLARDLADWFDRHGTPNEQMRAYYILGRTYADRGEAPQAIAAYNDAADKADTTAADCDYAKLSRVYAQKAEVFYYQLLPDNMVHEERQAMRYAQMAKDTMQYLYCYGMLAEGYDMKNMPDSALSILKEAYSLYKKVGECQLASALCCSMTSICIQKKDFQLADKYLLEYESGSGFFDENGNIEYGREIYYFRKGLLCLETFKKDEAEYYFRKLLGTSESYNLKIAGFDGLQRYYSQYFNKDSLIKYDRLSDSICCIAHNEMEIQKTMQVQAMYDYTRNELIANEKSREASQLRYLLVIVISLVVILILLFVIIYIRHKAARQLLESQYRTVMEKLVQAQEDLLSLRSEQSISLRLLRQKEIDIKTLQENADQYRHKIKTLQGYALNERLQQASVTIRFQKYLKENPYQIPTWEDWKELKILVNHEIPSFYDTLNVDGNSLNEFEYDVCVLLRLQFSPVNIAKLKKCTPSYITQIRKSIYQKLFQKDGRAEELDDYILTLS